MGVELKLTLKQQGTCLMLENSGLSGNPVPTVHVWWARKALSAGLRFECWAKQQIANQNFEWDDNLFRRSTLPNAAA